MVQITRVYTRSGDKGKSSLGDGTRRKKSDIRFEAIGDIDEANSYIGLVSVDVTEKLQKIIRRIQNDLFDLGADLAVPQGETLRIDAIQVEFLEIQIDYKKGFDQHLINIFKTKEAVNGKVIKYWESLR